MSAEILARKLRQADKVVRQDVDLGTARLAVGATSLIDTFGQRVTILVNAGVYSLVFVFADASTLTLASTELAQGDILDFEFAALYVLNAAQTGVTLSLLIDKRV
jgi:hypothetical protein